MGESRSASSWMTIRLRSGSDCFSGCFRVADMPRPAMPESDSVPLKRLSKSSSSYIMFIFMFLRIRSSPYANLHTYNRINVHFN
ncbi:hypothetical protein Hanom_Chr07g00654721 [Helianthus anomalus]